MSASPPPENWTSFTRRLVDSAERRVRLHARRAPQWTVQVDAAGQILSVMPHPKPARGQAPYTVLAPREAKSRTNTTAPLLITDNAEYALGIPRTPQGADRARHRHAAYLALLEAHAAHPVIQAVLRAAQTLPPGQRAEMDALDLVTYRVDGLHPHDLPDLQAAWITHARPPGDAGTGMDASTGAVGPLAEHGPPLTGVPGGLINTVLQSTFQDTNVHYGLRTLGVTQETAETAAATLARLVRSPVTSHLLPGQTVKILHWISGPEAELDPWTALAQPGPEEVHAVLTAQADALPERGSTDVNVAVVTASSSRVRVLSYATLPLSDAARHVRAFLRRTGRRPLSELEAALSSGDPPPRADILSGLHLHALLGQPLPPAVQATLTQRWRRTLHLTPAQTALLTLTFPEHLLPQEAPMPGPDALPLTSVPDPDLRQAYLLGVYAAQAHATHRRLNPGVGVTVTDRYLRLLAAQPDRAFALMQQHLQAVLKSARGQQRWLADHLAAELAQVLTDLSVPLPARLTIPQQAALALGHQHRAAQLHQEQQTRFTRSHPHEGAAS